MKIVPIIFFTALCFNLSQAFWSVCTGSGIPSVDDMTSPTCSAERCRAIRGEIFEATILTTLHGAHNELRTRLTAFLFGIGINLPVVPPFDDMCNFLHFTNGTKASCPTIPNTQYHLEIAMLVSPNYPTLNNARVQGDFFDGDSRVLCIQVISDII